MNWNKPSASNMLSIPFNHRLTTFTTGKQFEKLLNFWTMGIQNLKPEISTISLLFSPQTNLKYSPTEAQFIPLPDFVCVRVCVKEHSVWVNSIKHDCIFLSSLVSLGQSHWTTQSWSLGLSVWILHPYPQAPVLFHCVTAARWSSLLQHSCLVCAGLTLT